MATPTPGAGYCLAGTEIFVNRLRRNLRHVGKWARRQAITCYRVYDADLPDYAIAIDLYERWAHVQEYAAPASIDLAKADVRLRDAVAAIPVVLGIAPDHVAVKVRRQQKRAAQYTRHAQSGRFQVVHEGGLQFWVNLWDYLDTGLFLDHRPTRGMIREIATDRRFLNLFAYTGAASVYAAAGGAAATTTVDMSAVYLDWARRNMALNGFHEGERHRFVTADCLAWLETPRRNRFDLIFLDPPTFSNSKRMGARTFDVQRDHVWLIRAAAKLLSPDGVLLFSNNFRHFTMDRASLPGLDIQDISRASIPPDFERNSRIHTCWRITARR